MPPTVYGSTLRLRLTFSAVFPLPERSYAALSFGLKSFRLSPAVSGNWKFRDGASWAGPIDCAGKLFLNQSSLNPPFTLRRSIDHRRAHRTNRVADGTLERGLRSPVDQQLIRQRNGDVAGHLPLHREIVVRSGLGRQERAARRARHVKYRWPVARRLLDVENAH